MTIDPKKSGIQPTRSDDGKDMRRRDSVLRILTDLLVLDGDHAGAERDAQEELMLGLIGEAGIVMRREIAERISAHATPPARLVNALARDDFSVAAPVLRHCRLLNDEDCAEIILTTTLDHARALAATYAPGPETIEAILALEDQAAIAVLLRNDEVRFDANALERLHRLAMDHGALAHGLMSRPGLTPPMLTDLFWFADAAKRQDIIERLTPLASSAKWRKPTRELMAPLRLAGAEGRDTACDGMATLLRSGQRDAFLGVFARALGVPAALAGRIVGDEIGEPFQIACRAVDIPLSHFTGYLIHYNPIIGCSIERVFALQRSYEKISLPLAWRMLEGWNATHHGERAEPQPATRTQRILDHDAYAVRTERSTAAYSGGKQRPPARPAQQKPGVERTGS